MRLFTVFLAFSFALFLVASCDKERPTQLCVENRTSADFVRPGSFFSLGSPGVANQEQNRMTNLAIGADGCINIDAGSGEQPWHALLVLENQQLGRWEGTVNITENTTNHLTISDVDKAYDFRDTLVGEYDFGCNKIVMVGNDTVSWDSVRVAGTINLDPASFLSVWVNASPYFSGVFTVFNDINEFSNIQGMGYYLPVAQEFVWYTLSYQNDSTIWNYCRGLPR